MADRPNVLVLATGGTIANPLDSEGYLTGQELIDEVPEVTEVADVAVKDVARIGSTRIRAEHWWDLYGEIEAAATSEEPPDGVVITHGSNTVEETAFFLHLTVNTEMPIVLTAAQRNHRQIGNDADRNLVDAVTVAGNPDSRGRGAMLVVNEDVHSARDVTKVARSRPDGWRSGKVGVLGGIDKQGNMEFLRKPEQRHAPDTEFTIADAEPDDFPRVDIVFSAALMDGSLIEAAVENGANGIVLAALPTGSVAKPGQAKAARQAHDEGTPIVTSNRGLGGGVSPEKYFIWANTLTPQKARILLALSLMETDNYDEIERMFTQY